MAFDPIAGEEAITLCCLAVVQARMNPYLAVLAIGVQVLKKTGPGYLFAVLGEPDIEVRAAGEGRS